MTTLLLTLLSCFIGSILFAQTNIVIKDNNGGIKHPLKTLNSFYHAPGNGLTTEGGIFSANNQTLYLSGIGNGNEVVRGVWDNGDVSFVGHYWNAPNIQAGYSYSVYNYPDNHQDPYWDDGFLVWDGKEKMGGHGTASWSNGAPTWIRDDGSSWQFAGASPNSASVMFRADKEGRIILTDGFRVLYNPEAKGNYNLEPHQIHEATFDNAKSKILVETVDDHLFKNGATVQIPTAGWSRHGFTIEWKSPTEFWLNENENVTFPLTGNQGIVQLWGGLPNSTYFHAYTGDRFEDCGVPWGNEDFSESFTSALPNGNFEKMDHTRNNDPFDEDLVDEGGDVSTVGLTLNVDPSLAKSGGIHTNNYIDFPPDGKGNGHPHYSFKYGRAEFDVKLQSEEYHWAGIYGFHNVPDCLPNCKTISGNLSNECADLTRHDPTNCLADDGTGTSGNDEMNFIDCAGPWYNSFWKTDFEGGDIRDDWNFGSIIGIKIEDKGSGFTSDPTVKIIGDGSGATATATLLNGQVESITVGEGGFYNSTTDLQVVISGGGFEDDVHAAINGTEQTITGNPPITNPPIPSVITATSGGAANDIGAIRVSITGTNAKDESVTEILPPFTANSATTIASRQTFKTVTSITIPAHDGTGATTEIGYQGAIAKAYFSNVGEDEVYHYNVGAVTKIPNYPRFIGSTSFVVNAFHAIPNNDQKDETNPNWHKSFSDDYHRFVGEWLPGELRFLSGTLVDGTVQYTEVGRTTRFVPKDYGMGLTVMNHFLDAPVNSAPGPMQVKNITVNALDPSKLCDPNVANKLAPNVETPRSKNPITITNVNPNPAQDKISFQMLLPEELREQMSVRIEIFNVLGQPVLRPYESLMNQKNGLTFSVKDLPNGRYYIRAICGNLRASSSFVIQR